MMVKFGKLVSTKPQTYYKHGKHLAVQELLYEKFFQKIHTPEESCDQDEDSSDEFDTETSFLVVTLDKTKKK